MLKIFNSMGRELEVFEPLEQGKISFYQCGPTVYWTQHIGNMRAMVMSDLVRRSLNYLNYDVKFVRNYTDFGHLTGDNIGDADTGEDKMDKGARREGTTPQKIADKYILEFETDVAALNIMEPDIRARATHYIQEMIDMVQILLDKDFAYTTPAAIYFDIKKFPEYTKLSGQRLEENRSGEGHGDVVDSNKRNPQDFAIWFFRTGVHANALQYWDSPFHSPEVENGRGFPGWHIECSAMVRATLGTTIDIHMGGVEHIPTHHTNEIAQSEAVTGVKYVNYWIHNEHLDVDGTKMSKSLGNVYNLSAIVEKGFDPIHLRYFFLQSHYRSKQNFTFEALEASKKAYTRLLNFVKSWSTQIKESTFGDSNPDAEFQERFVAALEDDFNIPQALAVVWEVIKSDLSDIKKLETVLSFDRVLGLKLSDTLENPEEAEILSVEAQILLEERKIARINKDWKTADQLRDRLKNEFGIEVRDN
jgi:cysteinyl-tRNA synthetase